MTESGRSDLVIHFSFRFPLHETSIDISFEGKTVYSSKRRGSIEKQAGRNRYKGTRQFGKVGSIVGRI